MFCNCSNPNVEAAEVIPPQGAVVIPAEGAVPMEGNVPVFECGEMHRSDLDTSAYQIVEEIVEVPKIVYEEEVVEREVPQIETVLKYVETPVVEERIVYVPKIEVQEVIVEVPKVVIVERPSEQENGDVPGVGAPVTLNSGDKKAAEVGATAADGNAQGVDEDVRPIRKVQKYVEVVQVVNVQKFVDIPVVQVVEQIVEVPMEVPQIQTVQKFVEVEQIQYVDVPVTVR